MYLCHVCHSYVSWHKKSFRLDSVFTRPYPTNPYHTRLCSHLCSKIPRTYKKNLKSTHPTAHSLKRSEPHHTRPSSLLPPPQPSQGKACQTPFCFCLSSSLSIVSCVLVLHCHLFAGFSPLPRMRQPRRVHRCFLGPPLAPSRNTIIRLNKKAGNVTWDVIHMKTTYEGIIYIDLPIYIFLLDR